MTTGIFLPLAAEGQRNTSSTLKLGMCYVSTASSWEGNFSWLHSCFSYTDMIQAWQFLSICSISKLMLLFLHKKKKKWKLPPTSITFALKKSYSFGSTPSNRNLRQQFFKQKSEDCAQPEVLISVFLIIISLITKLITTFFTFLAVRTVFHWIFFKQSIFIVYKTLCQTTGALGRVAVYFT